MKVRSYPGATIEDMRHNIIPILKRKPSTIILHVGTNDTNNCISREIMDKLLSLKKYITDRNKDCKVIVSEIITRLDDGVTTLKVSKFNILLSELNIPTISNRNICKKHLGSRGLHLNQSGNARFAMNFISAIRKL